MRVYKYNCCSLQKHRPLIKTGWTRAVMKWERQQQWAKREKKVNKIRAKYRTCWYCTLLWRTVKKSHFLFRLPAVDLKSWRQKQQMWKIWSFFFNIFNEFDYKCKDASSLQNKKKMAGSFAGSGPFWNQLLFRKFLFFVSKEFNIPIWNKWQVCTGDLMI